MATIEQVTYWPRHRKSYSRVMVLNNDTFAKILGHWEYQPRHRAEVAS